MGTITPQNTLNLRCTHTVIHTLTIVAGRFAPLIFSSEKVTDVNLVDIDLFIQIEAFIHKNETQYTNLLHHLLNGQCAHNKHTHKRLHIFFVWKDDINQYCHHGNHLICCFIKCVSLLSSFRPHHLSGERRALQ